MHFKVPVNFIVALICFSFPFSLYASKINIVTENFPPFHYMENGEAKGSVIELMTPVLAELDLTPQDIQFYPWARAYKIAEQNSNTLLFSLVRFPAREELFKWIAPVGFIKVGVFKLKKRTDIKINSIADLNLYSSGVIIDSAIHHLYKQEHFDNFEEVNNSDSLVQMLMRGRIDVVPASSHSFISAVSKMGFNVNDIERVYYIQSLEKGLWAAFNKDTNDEVVQQMKRAIDKATMQTNIPSLPFNID